MLGRDLTVDNVHVCIDNNEERRISSEGTMYMATTTMMTA